MKKLFTYFSLLLTSSVFAQTNAPGITVTPLGTNGSTPITVTMTLSQVCVPAGKDMDPSWNTIAFHSGAIVGGNAWQNVVSWNAPNSLVFNKVSDGVWSATFTPNDYYGVAVQGFSFVFNGFPNTPGDWDAEAKAFDENQNCSDFFWYFNDEPLSTNNAQLKNLSVYPNPAQDVLNIQFDLAKSGNISYELLNTMGQRVINEQLGQRNEGSNIHQINLSGLTKGIYLLKLNNGDNSTTKIISVQ
jgi:hypothetical protein